MVIRFTGFALIDCESAHFMQMSSALHHDLLHHFFFFCLSLFIPQVCIEIFKYANMPRVMVWYTKVMLLFYSESGYTMNKIPTTWGGFITASSKLRPFTKGILLSWFGWKCVCLSILCLSVSEYLSWQTPLSY